MKSADLFTPQSLSEAELLRAIKRKKREKWEDLLASQIKASGLPPFIREHPFAKPERMWRLDFAQLDFKVYVEIQGAIHGRPVVCNRCKQVVKTFNATTGKSFVVMTGGGRHSRPDGMRDDAEKAAALAIRGWAGFPCVPDQVESGAALDWLTRLLIFRGWQKGGSSGQEAREGRGRPEAELPVSREPEAPTGAPGRDIRQRIMG
jgi:very-short-patch-repair endonuclease